MPLPPGFIPPAHESRDPALRRGVAARDQARRLPPYRPPRPGWRPPVHPQRIDWTSRVRARGGGPAPAPQRWYAFQNKEGVGFGGRFPVKITTVTVGFDNSEQNG